MKAFQCSKCNRLNDFDIYCQCNAGIDPRPTERVKGDAQVCIRNFEQLEEGERWHQPFSWEK